MPFDRGPDAITAVLRLATLPSLRSLTLECIEPDVVCDIVARTTSSQVCLIGVVFIGAGGLKSNTIEDDVDLLSPGESISQSRVADIANQYTVTKGLYSIQ